MICGITAWAFLMVATPLYGVPEKPLSDTAWLLLQNTAVSVVLKVLLPCRCLKTKRLPPCQCLHMVNSSARKWSCLFSPFDLIHRHWRPGGRKTLWEYTRQNEKNWKNRHEMWINKNGISCCFILWYHTGLRLRRAGFSEESPFPVI